MDDHSEKPPHEPAVLVVEDQPALLEQRLESFASHGIRGFGALSAEDAAALLASGEVSISLAIVDINLRPNDSGDRSGLALARMIRDSEIGVPLVGYSAHFESGSFSRKEKQLFQAWIEKGRLLAEELGDRYAELALDVAASEHTFQMARSRSAADALIAFLAETEKAIDDRVETSRSILKREIGDRAYDPFDPEPAPYNPLQPEQPAKPTLPEELAETILVVAPEPEVS